MKTGNRFYDLPEELQQTIYSKIYDNVVKELNLLCENPFKDDLQAYVESRDISWLWENSHICFSGRINISLATVFRYIKVNKHFNQKPWTAVKLIKAHIIIHRKRPSNTGIFRTYEPKCVYTYGEKVGKYFWSPLGFDYEIPVIAQVEPNKLEIAKVLEMNGYKKVSISWTKKRMIEELMSF